MRPYCIIILLKNLAFDLFICLLVNIQKLLLSHRFCVSNNFGFLDWCRIFLVLQ